MWMPSRLQASPVRSSPSPAQLADAVLAEDAQLVVPQKLLLRELATSEDPSATQALVALVSNPRTSPELTELARSALAHRHNGAPSMLAALERHYDFLKGALRSPPVAPLAQALAGMKTKAAAPLLTAHLLNPADSDEDVRQATAALAVLAGPSELPSLRQFFGMYRATCAGNEDISDAVVDVARAMLDVGDHIARERESRLRRSIRQRFPPSRSDCVPWSGRGDRLRHPGAIRERPQDLRVVDGLCPMNWESSQPSTIPSSSARDDKQHSRFPRGTCCTRSVGARQIAQRLSAPRCLQVLSQPQDEHGGAVVPASVGRAR